MSKKNAEDNKSGGVECPSCGGQYKDLRQHRHYKPECKPDSWDKCPECGEKYKKIGQHWSIGPCDWPTLSNKQLEVATGLLMGDGTLVRNDKNPHIQVQMITKEYLQYLDSLFGVHGKGVRLSETAEHSANNAKKTGFSPNAKPKNYSDIYRWLTGNHPDLQRFVGWYTDNGKVWPRDIDLTPTALKHWFVGDGSRDETPYGQSRIHIAMSNEIDHTDKVDRMFIRAGLPEPSEYNIQDRGDGSLSCMARWTMKGSNRLWDYMGEPIPGFEYKWPKEYL